MTAYAVGFQSTASGTPSQPVYAASAMVAIRAGLYAVRLIQVQAKGMRADGAEVGSLITRYETSTISGGVVLTPASLREGAAPVSATVRHRTATWTTATASISLGTAVTVTGTARQMGSTPEQSGGGWSPPSDIVVSPGSTLHLAPHNDGMWGACYLTFTIWFDEEHVSRST